MRSLSSRLFLSYVVVALAGAATTFVVVRLTASALFENRVAGMQGMARGSARGELLSSFVSAVDLAMVVGAAASLVVAAVAAALIGRRLLRPVEHVRDATRRIARGDYGHRVPVPAEPDLVPLARDVNALGAALAETEARRVRLLGDIAHELRTPLTVMEGQLEGLADGVFTPGPQVYAELEAEVGRMRRLAADLGELSRVQEGRLEVRREPLDLRSVVEAVTSRLEQSLAAADVTVSMSLPPTALVVLGDEQRLVQVVTNLVDNAVHAMPGGGSLHIEAAETGGRALLTVTDTGRGLAPEELERVFERFWRGGAGSPRRDGGTGIGLTISRGIALALDGDLTATSPGPGRGAAFTLSLPVPAPSPSTAVGQPDQRMP